MIFIKVDILKFMDDDTKWRIVELIRRTSYG